MTLNADASVKQLILSNRANTSTTVTLDLGTEESSTPLDWALYLPEHWIKDPIRRKEAGVPEDVTFKTKPELAVASYNIGVVSLRLKRREVALRQCGLLSSMDSNLAIKLYNGIYQGKVLALHVR